MSGLKINFNELHRRLVRYMHGPESPDLQHAKSIQRSADRLVRFIELDTPSLIIEKEIELLKDRVGEL